MVCAVICTGNSKSAAVKVIIVALVLSQTVVCRETVFEICISSVVAGEYACVVSLILTNENAVLCELKHTGNCITLDKH